ncbi:hypothetical protein MKC44_25670, partial [[Clostridium] innocuum]|nr:hypothetical protein [[Clostridium] innocuum]
SHQKIQYILQNIQKKTISFRKLPIYNKKPMSLRKGIGFCQQSETLYSVFLSKGYVYEKYRGAIAKAGKGIIG